MHAGSADGVLHDNAHVVTTKGNSRSWSLIAVKLKDVKADYGKQVGHLKSLYPLLDGIFIVMNGIPKDRRRHVEMTEGEEGLLVIYVGYFTFVVHNVKRIYIMACRFFPHHKMNLHFFKIIACRLIMAM